MLDVYAMNRKTGELLPVSEAIREFYAAPGRQPLADWLEEWQPLENMPVAGSELSAPDFVGTISR